MKAVTCVLLVLGIGLASGCAQLPRGGVVVPGGPEVTSSSRVPDITFVTNDGETTTLDKVRKPITIIGFVAPSGEACCALSPELVDLTTHYWHLPVTVVQVSQPTSACPHGPGCSEKCNLHEGSLVALCDSKRVAWKAFAQPKLNTVFLIDEHGRLLDQASIHNLKALDARAKQLATAVHDEFERDMEFGEQ